MRFFILATLFLSFSSLFAQLPQTQIWVAPLKVSKNKISLGNAGLISKSTGYNNQPNFSADGKKLLFVSKEDTSNTDVFEYDFKTKQRVQITSTPENEYSPVFSPDGKFFTAVHGPEQKLMKFTLSGKILKPLTSDSDSVGYYCWVNDHLLATFTLPSPFTLNIQDINNKNKKAFAVGIGRSLNALTKESTLFFVQKRDSANWMIMAMILRDDSPMELMAVVKTPPGCEDFAILNDGTLLAFFDTRLFKYNIVKDQKWKEIADFQNTGVDGFYRIAVSPKKDRIAMVSYSGKRP